MSTYCTYYSIVFIIAHALFLKNTININFLQSDAVNIQKYLLFYIPLDTGVS